ncbi:MAG: hypothetical protein NTW56_18265 [Alphaproteobacteria bacterium]|nr:hypothetical protein [Alphaproteobacteria bacterium]
MRILGWVLIAIAFALGFAFSFGQPLGQLIFTWDSGFIPTLQAGVQRNIAPGLWDWFFLPLLERPVWVGPFLLGCLVFFVHGLWKRATGRMPAA